MHFTISFIEKDAQLITLIIIVNWSVWLLCTVKVAPEFMLFFLLRLYYFNLLYGALSLSWPPPPPPPPHHLLSLKQSNVLLWHLIWTANLEPKTCIDVSKNVVFNVWIRLPILDDLRRLHPLSPEEAPRTSRWGVGELIAEMRTLTCNCLI